MLIEKKFEKGQAVEILRFTVTEELVERFITLDHDIWTIELSKVDGFIAKDVWINKLKPCEITTIIYWESLEKWKAIDHDFLAETDAYFNSCIGVENFTIEGLHENNDYHRILQTTKVLD